MNKKITTKIRRKIKLHNKNQARKNKSSKNKMRRESDNHKVDLY